MKREPRPSTPMAAGTLIQLKEISHISGIASLSRIEQASLVPRLRRRTILPNRLIFKKGEIGLTMAFISSGSVKIRYPTRSSDEMIVALLCSGDYFGEIGMVTKRPRSFDVMTVTRTEILELSRDEFIRHSQVFKGLSLSLLVSLAGRLDDAGKRIIDLGEHDIPTRIMRILTKLAKPDPLQITTKLIVAPRPSQHDLLGLIGAPREVVWNALRELERSGSITMEEDRILIQPVAVV